MVLAFKPAARPTSTKLTPSGVPDFSGSTGRGAIGADCAHSGRASPRTFSSDRTRVDRLRDFRSSRREKGKRDYPGISSCWTVPLNSYSLCLDTLQAAVVDCRSKDCRLK